MLSPRAPSRTARILRVSEMWLVGTYLHASSHLGAHSSFPVSHSQKCTFIARRSFPHLHMLGGMLLSVILKSACLLLGEVSCTCVLFWDSSQLLQSLNITFLATSAQKIAWAWGRWGPSYLWVCTQAGQLPWAPNAPQPFWSPRVKITIPPPLRVRAVVGM